MNKFDEIIAAAQSLASQGKEPTVALLKSQIKAPLPSLIKGLQMWQQNPNKEIKAVNKEKVESENTLEINAQLQGFINKAIEEVVNQKLAPLEKELAELQKKLSKLDCN